MPQPPVPPPSSANEEASIRFEPVWVKAEVALTVHDRQLAEHGGGTGVRDASGLEFALARPRNRWENGEDDPAALAAAYAFGIVRNHPFVDGSKRTGWVIANLFLALNGRELAFDELDAIQTVERLAASEIVEAKFSGWLQRHIAAI